jgi:hypothetical protein
MARRSLPARVLNARDAVHAQQIDAALLKHARRHRTLPGIRDVATRETFVRQVIDSIHRVRFPAVIAARPVSQRRCDPNYAELFDPVRASIYYQQHGHFDEGWHPRGGYRYARNVYGRLGQGRWDWATVSANPVAFTRWLGANYSTIRTTGGTSGFGSHRKRETLHPSGTGRTVETYVAWVDPSSGHRVLFQTAVAAAQGDGAVAFARLYDSMAAVHRFGRTARFDYLTMLGKLDFVRIHPGSTFLKDATGPLKGARLLYGVGPGTHAAVLEDWLIELDADLQVGAQALEDAICNWQKQPGSYRPFRG